MPIKRKNIVKERHQRPLARCFDKDCYIYRGWYLNRQPVDRFKDDDAARQYWEAFGEEMLTNWLGRQKEMGSMPWAWYKFDKGITDPRKLTAKEKATLQPEIAAFWA